MCNINFIIIALIVILCVQFNTQNASQFTFQNVTVHLRVSNVKVSWIKIFLARTKSINDIVKKAGSKVKVISFRKQRIPILFKNSVRDVLRLNKLKLNFCDLEELEVGCLKNVTRIFEFDVSNNIVRDIKYGVFNKMGISRLYLNNNKIYEIQRGAFSAMDNLELIVLSHNRITTWDATWFLKTPVRHVDFSSNMIEELPTGAFDYFNEFKKKFYGEFYYINFNDNVLTKLQKKSLPGTPFLWFLYLEKNFIEEIEDDSFFGIKRMEVLNLGHNKLRNFDYEILDNMDLRCLKLNNNELETIDVNITEILDIEDNPLSVDCKIQWEERKKRDQLMFDRYLYDL